MRRNRSGSFIGSAAIAAAIVPFASAAFAFSVHIGSFHISITPHWHRHYRHHHFVARGRPNGLAQATRAHGTASPFFYPQLALPDMLADVFSSSSAWPFDFGSIVPATFTGPETVDAQACEPQSNLADKFLPPVDAALELTDAQAQLLDKVGDALDAAQSSLVKSCPSAIPSTPIARLQLMDSQIGQLAAGLGGVRQPLQNFQHALTDEQLARAAGMIAAPTVNSAGGGPGNAALGCGGDTSAATDRTVSLIDQTVEPDAAQRDALNTFKEALGDAARALQADCATPMPPTELGRLGMIVTHLDATRLGLASIEAALTKLRAALNDEQKARLDAASFAAR
jgi:LTXXQ motif family protein